MANRILNTAAAANAQKVRTGKDGALYNSQGKLLASMESFQSQMSVNNTKYQPLGTNQEYEVNTSYGVTLTFSELVVEANEFITDLLNCQETGVLPDWSFTGKIQGLTKTQAYVYPNCVPSGTIDLQNVQSGDIIKRAWSMYVNGKVKRQGTLG